MSEGRWDDVEFGKIQHKDEVMKTEEICIPISRKLYERLIAHEDVSKEAIDEISYIVEEEEG